MADRHLRCSEILPAGHRRAGEPCGRRYMAPHQACSAHRPRPAGGHSRPQTEEQRDRARAHAATRARRARAAGLPEGW